MIKQRHFGSMMINRNVNPAAAVHRLSQSKTNCVELNGLINFETMKLYMDDSDDSNNITPEALKDLCMAAGDNSFNIHVDAVGKNALLASLEALNSVRSAGYKKSTLTLAHSESLLMKKNPKQILALIFLKPLQLLGILKINGFV